jgi:hypothetical protein
MDFEATFQEIVQGKKENLRQETPPEVCVGRKDNEDSPFRFVPSAFI